MLGEALLRVLAALAIALLLQHLGYLLLQRIATVDLVFELAATEEPIPQMSGGVTGLRSVHCQKSNLSLLRDAMYSQWRASASGAEIYTCRFRFDLAHDELLALPLRLTDLPAAVMGATAVPGLAAWMTRQVVEGSEVAYQLFPSLFNLMLVLVCAAAAGFRFRDDLRRTLAGIEPRKFWRPLSLMVMPSILTVLDAWGRKVLLASNVLPAADVQPWIRAFSAGITAPVVEELVYRVWMIPFLTRSMNSHFAVLVSSMLFSYGHGHSFMFYALNGLAFGYLWHYTRSATWCIAAHALVNSPALSIPVWIALSA